MAAIDRFECSSCGERVSSAQQPGVCPACRALLTVQYDLASIAKVWPKDSLKGRVPSIWRYAEVLPDVSPVTLGEGFTPLLAATSHRGLLIKDESRNPGGSVHARGASLAASVAHSRGTNTLSAEQEGAAAPALAAYCAAAGIDLSLSIPGKPAEDVRAACEAFGAHVTLASEGASWPGDFPALEPFALEGMKTLGYEIAEQLNWQLPNALIWPGNDIGWIAISKAFDELRELGWLKGVRSPKFFAAQHKERSDTALRIIRNSGGAALGVTHDEVASAASLLASKEGILASAEGARGIAIYRKLLAEDAVHEGDSVVVVLTGAGALQMPAGRKSWIGAPKSRSIGGIIQPY